MSARQRKMSLLQDAVLETLRTLMKAGSASSEMERVGNNALIRILIIMSPRCNISEW